MRKVLVTDEDAGHRNRRAKGRCRADATVRWCEG